ncbi:STE3-type pheromone receptor [Agaricus bisporus var. burnettii JB137-S8]|uniref:STE3-type pheromone receptor n=1 Tax=Agaricus bisporus var. burnettii (strain JB137-S8 / ATCC MYA-4627 / FGSC 10392) TaxID=597362 RepID=K5WUD2_AGABU|nr:STE3-type pheromone receptor [Agaricus bisporus var. burnettii JB137-S8]EKM79051.1 STE3-type pheromone receptor [Agaricus bisporus var. burnettii JB137-S8]
MGYPASYPNWVFSLFALIGFIIVSIPFPWHLEAWNTGTCLYMAWTAIACLNQFINSVVWSKDAINYAPIWCDISSRIMVGTAVAIPAASLCINRRLYRIASVRRVMITKAEKRQQVMVDLAIGLGLPILEMVLQICASGHRFNIFEEVGCYPYTYNTWVALLLVSAPPIVIGLVSAVYGVLSIRALYRTRAQSRAILSVYSNLNTGRYLRLMALSGLEIICTVPLGIYATYLNLQNGALHPWISWADTHYGYSRVDQIPSILWRANSIEESSLELTRWICVVCAVLFFAFFGFADEARSRYRSAATTIGKHLGISTITSSSTVYDSQMPKDGTGSIPGPSEKRGRKNSSGFSLSNQDQSVDDLPQEGAPATNEKKGHNLAYVFGKKKFNDEVFKPTFCYDDLVLPDIGGTLVNNESCEISPVPTSGSSSASSITVPHFPEASSDASDTDSPTLDPPFVSTEPRRNSHDMV